MQNLRILNTREIKPILKSLKTQFGFESKLKFCFLRNNKDKIFFVNKDISRIDLNNLRINTLGLYFGTVAKEGFRLSIEGSQMIGPDSDKNILDLNKEQSDMWRQGMDFEVDSKLNGFVLVKYGEDFLGCGKLKDKKLLNYNPKGRRLIVIND